MKTQDLLSEVKLLPAGQDPKTYYTNDTCRRLRRCARASMMRARRTARIAAERRWLTNRGRAALRRPACRNGVSQSRQHDHRRRSHGFAGLTGDYSELHTSDVYARASEFGRRVAHGMLGLAYAHGLMWARTGELRETAIAFLGINEWKFVAPIFIGDTIFVNYGIAELRDSRSRPTQAIATFDVAS